MGFFLGLILRLVIQCMAAVCMLSCFPVKLCDSAGCEMCEHFPVPVFRETTVLSFDFIRRQLFVVELTAAPTALRH